VTRADEPRYPDLYDRWVPVVTARPPGASTAVLNDQTPLLTMMGATAYMHHHRKQGVGSVPALSIGGCVGELQLEREHHPAERRS